MPMVGDRFYTRIEGLPECAREGCTKRASRRESWVDSRFCRRHTIDEIERLMAEGLPFHLANRQIWNERPIVQLTFIP